MKSKGNGGRPEDRDSGGGEEALVGVELNLPGSVTRWMLWTTERADSQDGDVSHQVPLAGGRTSGERSQFRGRE